MRSPGRRRPGPSATQRLSGASPPAAGSCASQRARPRPCRCTARARPRAAAPRALAAQARGVRNRARLPTAREGSKTGTLRDAHLTGTGRRAEATRCGRIAAAARTCQPHPPARRRSHTLPRQSCLPTCPRSESGRGRRERMGRRQRRAVPTPRQSSRRAVQRPRSSSGRGDSCRHAAGSADDRPPLFISELSGLLHRTFSEAAESARWNRPALG